MTAINPEDQKNLAPNEIIQELFANIQKAKSEILEQFLVNSKLERKWKKVFLQGTNIEVTLKLKFARNKSNWAMFEAYYIYLEESKEPIHTLWILIKVSEKNTLVEPIFDKDVEDYLSLKEVELMNQSK